MRVESIEPHGFCTGVACAVGMAERALAAHAGGKVYALHEIVHNEQVVRDLERRGMVFVSSLAEVPEGACVLFSAHGVSPAVRTEARRRGLEVVDATCPFVARLHRRVAEHVAAGRGVVVIGRPGHVEVEGLVGEGRAAGGEVCVVRAAGEVAALPFPEGACVGVVSQTTFAHDALPPILDALARRYRVATDAGTGDVCTATRDRQAAVAAFVRGGGDGVLVLGGTRSSNTARLAEVALKAGARRVARLSSLEDLARLDLAGIRRLGITSGTSTSEAFFARVLNNLTHGKSCVRRRDFLLRSAASAAVGAFFPKVLRAHETGETVDYRRRFPVRIETDVMVCGGGAAGVAAAVAARTAGARVFLAESFTCFGGMGTAARVPLFMQWGDGERDLACGFGTSFRERLKKAGGFFNGAFDFEVVKRTYDRVMAESGADFLFHTKVIDVRVEKGRITHAICASQSGIWAVRAKVFVDATGNGDVAVLSGVPFEKGDAAGNMMPASLLSAWDGVDWERWSRERPKTAQPFGAELARAAADGVFREKDLHMTGLYRFPNGYATANIGHVFGLDGTDERSLTKGYLRGRASMAEYARYFREYLKRGMENIRLVETAAMMGVRETRRIRGDYVMTLEDYMKRAVFPDEIGRYAYPIDIHPSSADQAAYARHRAEFDRLYRYGRGESYGIPYRILCAQGMGNLLVAGRCVSTDQKVQASIRVMPACYITGQAAGLAAALAAAGTGDVHAIAVLELQRRLKAFGAYLPNAAL